MRRQQKSRNPWSALLAVLLGTLAGASALAFNPSFTGGLSIAELGADARTAGKTASIRPDAYAPSLKLGSSGDDGSALHPRQDVTDAWAAGLRTLLPAALGLPVDVARTRDGRTRAPPAA